MRTQFRLITINLIMVVIALFFYFQKNASAFDLQLMGDMTAAVKSPLDNQTAIAGGGTVRLAWEYAPDWNITLTGSAYFFPTSTPGGVNPMTYAPTSGGMVSIIPVTVGVQHIFARFVRKKYDFYGVLDGGGALEYNFGVGHSAPEPFVDGGLGFGTKEFFIEERAESMLNAFGSIPNSPSGPLLLFTTSIGVHFFQF
ncbi:hypothetical protein [Leptospirillum ferrooxidans]|uniref:Uncharacterized protein n=1 Tax=Leptospirillum ferrooxidans (strain C2-3) TaxID=1162668 RepID=I0IPX6_LEPFC|nr:hypothetical protein [Leptospirillum ferrooxidans]MDA8060157.1 hypothetical protein [Nitrospiraceae bacterium]BAM07325.1 hypothetical protein LFE_1644 [Leptospirillum ferrooxidans C2-3]